jgi:high-affinity iron transporter
LRFLPCALSVVAALAFGAPRSAAAAGDPEEHARRAIHLLAYIAADYPGAVEDGRVVSEIEYQEQLDFAASIREQLKALDVASDDDLSIALGRFDADLLARAPAESISAQANAIAMDVRMRFRVRALPPRTPDLAQGAAHYATACASCHGTEGAGDGPAGRGLDPAPASFRDATRAASLSPFALFSTITYGIAGTGMAGFEAQLDDAARWDLAYYVGSLGFSPLEVERGGALLEKTPAARIPDLARLSHHSVAEFVLADADAAPLLAYLRTHPAALRTGELPLEIARSRLADSFAAFERGDATSAIELATSSYLDGFEHVEPALNAVDGSLRAEIEGEYVRYRAALRAGGATAEITAIHRSLADRLTTAETRLAKTGLGATAVFTGALTILAREGLEAVLLVVAILGVLGRTGRSDAKRFVHAGWITALVAGAATWWVASTIVAVSGASREVIEGVSALLATAILFYISYWLLSKTEAARWQAFLDERFKAALSRGSLGMLTGLTFVAVYREVFETVLFFQALAAQAGPEGSGALLSGMAAGVLLLVVLALSVFRLGQRLPIRRFFAASSVLLYALAVVLAGHGVAALQEAGWIPATPASFFRFEWLGIYPTWQGLALQGTLLLAALVALPLVTGAASGARREPKASAAHRARGGTTDGL